MVIQGFKTAAVAAGIKAGGTLDLSLIVSDTPATTAAVFTQNTFMAAPLIVSKKHLETSGHRMRAVIVNSGNANAATGEAGIQAALIVLAGVFPAQLDTFVEYKLTPVVHDLISLKALDRESSRRQVELGVHLKIDTGMGRLGFLAAEADQWIAAIKQAESLHIQGVFSHFSHAESVQGDYTQKQLEIFKRVLGQLRSAGVIPDLVHLANSAATITLPAAYFDMVRPGLMLYGVYPSPNMKEQINLKPVLSWKTKILQLKNVPSGTSVSYGQTYVTERESLIATLPIGYADGYPRFLSNRGEALVRGQRARIAGRVCMDLTMIDVTDIRNVRQGDEVVLLGRQGGAEISADEIAAWANTISYEILTSIGTRVPRIHYNS